MGQKSVSGSVLVLEGRRPVQDSKASTVLTDRRLPAALMAPSTHTAVRTLCFHKDQAENLL